MKITKKQLIKTIREELAIMQEEDPGDELATPNPKYDDSITTFSKVLEKAGVKYVWLQSGDDFWLPDSKLNIKVHDSREIDGQPMRKKDLHPDDVMEVGVTVQDSREPVAPPMKKKDILP